MCHVTSFSKIHVLLYLSYDLFRCICGAGYEGDGLDCRPVNICEQPARGNCHQEVSEGSLIMQGVRARNQGDHKLFCIIINMRGKHKMFV